MKKDKRKKTNSNKKRTRQIILLIVEIMIMVLLSMVLFFIYEFNKININRLDDSKIVTNAAIETQESGTEIITQINAQGDVVEIIVPATKPSVNSDEEPSYANPFGDEKYKTIVIFGVDGRNPNGTYSKGSNSDVIILASINNENGQVKLCSVYRDTYMKFYGMDKYGKANAPFSGYDVYEAINTLNMNLDLNITDYVCIDWSAAIETINLLGGADIELKPEFYEIKSRNQGGVIVPYLNGLISELVNSTGIPSSQIPKEYFNGQMYHADGVQAVAFMRLRYTDSDFYRTQRQRNMINQMVEKAKKADIGTLLSFWDTLSKYVEVSLSESEILGMMYYLGNYSIVDTHGYPFQLYDGADYTGNMNYNIITVDLVKNVKQLHSFLYDDTDYEPTATVKRLDKELQAVANFKEDWTPNFTTKGYEVVDSDKYK